MVIGDSHGVRDRAHEANGRTGDDHPAALLCVSIDGLGGADSLTSKVAVIGPSTRPDADVDYLFLQVVVNEPRVDASQNCGNMLAGVAPFAIENGVGPVTGERIRVRIHMVNTQSIAIA